MPSKHLPAISPAHHKNTMNSVTQVMPIPAEVRIPMSMHIGAPCTPLVQPGDTVKVGQKIGDSQAPVSAPIHSSVSGTVTAVEQMEDNSGKWVTTVVIKADGHQEADPFISLPQINSREDFLKAVRECGLVGLGGAAFPTAVKYNPKNLDEVDTLLINGAECEPYITSDYRLMLEHTDEIVQGIRLVKKWLDTAVCKVCIEDNKPEAIRVMREALKEDRDIEVMPLPAKYPKGAERVLIYEATGRDLPLGKLPADVGVIVSNVSTVEALAEYVNTGMPLVKRRLTCDGNVITTPKNVEVPIGAAIRDVIEFCGGFKAEPKKILMGGPMMGKAVYTEDTSIIKNNNAILAFDKKFAEVPEETPCIRCGRCVKACPLHLQPAKIAKAVKAHNAEALVDLDVNLCMDCGSCAYVCPAKRPLNTINRLGKQIAAEGGKK